MYFDSALRDCINFFFSCHCKVKRTALGIGSLVLDNLDVYGMSSIKSSIHQTCLFRFQFLRIFFTLQFRHDSVYECSSLSITQVLDARDPIGTRCPHIETFLKKEKPHKHLVFVLNKCDLVPTWATVSIRSYLSKPPLL